MIDRIKNIILCAKFPFLRPRGTDGKKTRGWFGEWTELDAMPYGWRKAFGIDLCKDLKRVLVKGNCVQEYRVIEIKEKYGVLRWYDFGGPEDISSEVQAVISKYEKRSKEVCILCGAPATKVTEGYISYLCDACYREIAEVPDVEW